MLVVKEYQFSVRHASFSAISKWLGNMPKLFFIALLLPLLGMGHPGIGIVKDSRGNIYFTDLHDVWKITNGSKRIIVPNVHTHELYIDQRDYLYGEGSRYDDRENKFYHYLWRYGTGGKVDTVMGMKEAYLRHDFSLARDEEGNEYYLKRFLVPHTDTNHIYRKSPEGKETVWATGNFKSVNWLHPQEDGKVLYVSNNAIYSVDSTGNIQLVKAHVANAKPSFNFSKTNMMIWGIWQDHEKNIYAALYSNQSVVKIDTRGILTHIYTSKSNWAPLNGVLDNDNNLWVLESSDKNEIRVVEIAASEFGVFKKDKVHVSVLPYIITSGVLIGIALFYVGFRNRKK